MLEKLWLGSSMCLQSSFKYFIIHEIHTIFIGKLSYCTGFVSMFICISADGQPIAKITFTRRIRFQSFNKMIHIVSEIVKRKSFFRYN